MILDVSSRLHKIGITLDWGRRKRQLDVGIKTRAVCVVRVNKPGELERALHVKYKDLRLPQSEWFNLRESHLLELKQTLISARDSYSESLLRKTAPRRPRPYSYSKHGGSQQQGESWNDATDTQSSPRQPNPYSYSKYMGSQRQGESWDDATNTAPDNNSYKNKSSHKNKQGISEPIHEAKSEASDTFDAEICNQVYQNKNGKKQIQKNGSESCLSSLVACFLGALAVGFLVAGGNFFVAVVIGFVGLGMLAL